jgi:hypothetical protein
LPKSTNFSARIKAGAKQSGEAKMADKQSDADKAKAMREYREKHDAAMRRIASLRAARLARDAEPPPEKAKKKPRS